MTTIGAYEAKTHLARLLDEVEQGRTVTITRHGHAVAHLVPASPHVADAADVITALRAARKGVRRGRVSVRSMIADGRR
jgi:prevent-host-death family protein